jgi:hypothetical protein
MARINIDLGPTQDAVTLENIRAMLAWKPKRMMLSVEWKEALHEPRDADTDWSLVLPFCETLGNAFRTMCEVKSIGMRKSKSGDRCYTFLPDAKENEDALTRVRAWLGSVGKYVAIRDCLALSFALDYDKKEGNPNKAQTQIGRLRSRAKPYDTKPTADTHKAAEELVTHCCSFLDEMTCYETADAVCAMPPSKGGKAFDLPTHLAAGIASERGIEDVSTAARTIKARKAVKNTPVEGKLELLEGSIEIDARSVKGKTILLIDDLYQSGVSMNYMAMLLLEAGAKKVFGLAVEKTCRNDDNVS